MTSYFLEVLLAAILKRAQRGAGRLIRNTLDYCYLSFITPGEALGIHQYPPKDKALCYCFGSLPWVAHSSQPLHHGLLTVVLWLSKFLLSSFPVLTVQDLAYHTVACAAGVGCSFENINYVKSLNNLSAHGLRFLCPLEDTVLKQTDRYCLQ